jgi:DNA invertase Pin-like site-specific DNA recombinase
MIVDNCNASVGQMVAGVLFAVAQMERENLRENTKRGMLAAKKRGAKIGKRPVIFAKDLIPLFESGLTLTQVARKLRRSRQAIYNCLARENVDIKSIASAE